MSYLNGLYESNDIQINGGNSANEILSNDNIWNGTNQFNATTTFSGDVTLSNKCSLQKAKIFTWTSVDPVPILQINWGDPETLIITANSNICSTVSVYLPSISTANLGGKFRVIFGSTPLGVPSAPFIYIYAYGGATTTMLYNNVYAQNVTIDTGYNSIPYSPLGYEFIATTTGQVWTCTSVAWRTDMITKNNNAFTGTNSFNSSLPTSTVASTTGGTQILTRNLNDARYSQLSGSNTFSGNNTYSGTNTYNNTVTVNGNFVANCATSTGLIEGRINGVTVFAIGSFALGAPLSIAYGSGINQITFNVPPVFKSDIILDNGYTFNIGTPYGLGNIYVYYGTIQIQDNSGLNPAFYGHFETNTIEPTYTARNASFYTTFGNGQILTFGNSATTNELSIQFNNTTFNKPITILGIITANSLSITPTQLSFLNNVSSGTIGQSQIASGYCDLFNFQSIAGIKQFTSRLCGARDFIPYPNNYARLDAYNNGIITLGAEAGFALSSVGATNYYSTIIGFNAMKTKTLNISNVNTVGAYNFNAFSTANLQNINAFGGGNITDANANYSMTNVSIFGSNILFNPSTLYNPTSVTNASFFDAPGINLTSSVAISDVYAICTDQTITASNQGKIGKAAIPLTIYGNTTINNNLAITGNITGTVTMTGTVTNFKQTSTNTIQTANFSIPSSFNRYYFFMMKTAATFTVTFPQSNATTVNKEFIVKRLGGSGQALQSVGVAGPEGFTQAVFYDAGSLGTIATANLINAAQNAVTVLSIQTQDTTGAGTFSNTAGSTTVTIVTQTSGNIVIGGVYNFNNNIRSVTAFGTGLGGTGTYTINAAIIAANTANPYSSLDTFGWGVITKA